METVLRRLGFALWAVIAALPVHSGQLASESGQKPPPATGPEFVIRTKTQLVLVPFHVVRQGKYVEGLQASDIQLLEDGVPQRVAILEGPPGSRTGRSIPVEVILLLDVSLSVMNASLLDGFALKETLLDGLGDSVRISVYAFAGRLKRFTNPTNDVEKLNAALTSAYQYSHGGTRLYEAIMQTCRDAAKSDAQATRLMVILSDSFSTTNTPPENAVAVASHLGITLYPVVLGHDRVVQQALRSEGSLARAPGRVPGNRRRADIAGPFPGSPVQSDRQARAHDNEVRMGEFAAIGEATGGRSFDPKIVNNTMIRAILQSIVKQVQAEYVAGYYPTSLDKERTPHQVQVALANKKTGKLYGGHRVVIH